MYAPHGYHMEPAFSSLITPHPCQTLAVFEIPYNTTESDIHGLFAKFGPVTRVQKIVNGRAALVEFSEISSPTRLVHMAKINPFFVSTTPVRLEFSSQLIVDKGEKNLNQTTANDENEKAETSTTPTKILHLDISNVEYPITVEVIKSICQPHGTLKRIYIGRKNLDNSVEALVEYDNIEQAEKAREQIDGADIYSGCCNLTVTYSTAKRVHVSRNDTSQWDFATPAPKTLLEAGPKDSVHSLPGSFYSAAPVEYSTPFNYGMPSIPGMQFPNGPPCPGYWGTPQGGNQAMPAAPHAYLMMPVPPPVHAVTPEGIGIGHAISNMGDPNANRQKDMSIFNNELGCVLIVSDLPAGLNCDHMFNLFGLYGNIAKIRFLLSRPATVMIQYGNRESAEYAFKYLSNMQVMGTKLNIIQSNWSEIKDEKNLGTLPDGSPVMKNYMMEVNNRFRSPSMSSKSRILEASRTLHFFNAPPSFTPPDICLVFQGPHLKPPPRVLIFANKQPQKKTCLGLVEWDRTEDALNALVFCNNRPIHLSGHSHPFHLKLAFSPKPLNEDRNGMTMITYIASPPSPKGFKPSNTEVLFEESKVHAVLIETTEDDFIQQRSDNPDLPAPALNLNTVESMAALIWDTVEKNMTEASDNDEKPPGVDSIQNTQNRKRLLDETTSEFDGGILSSNGNGCPETKLVKELND